jgi:hypothetical protein
VPSPGLSLLRGEGTPAPTPTAANGFVEDDGTVLVPTVEGLLGDKLTAFAPVTIKVLKGGSDGDAHTGQIARVLKHAIFRFKPFTNQAMLCRLFVLQAKVGHVP